MRSDLLVCFAALLQPGLGLLSARHDSGNRKLCDQSGTAAAVHARKRCRQHTALCSISDSSGDDASEHHLDNNEGDWDMSQVQEAIVKKRQGKTFVQHKPTDNRDSLLYEVYSSAPPRRKLGQYKLHPSTGCGDMIEANLRQYIVRRITCQYKFVGGSFQMYRKEAEVTELMRAAAERIAKRMFDAAPAERSGTDDVES